MAWGVGLLMADRSAEAVKVFQRGIDEKLLPEENPAFYFYLAGALAMAERTDDALAAARIAAEKKKDSARFRGRVAWVLYGAKRYDEARKAYECWSASSTPITIPPRPATCSRGPAGAVESGGPAGRHARGRRVAGSRCSTSFPTTMAR